MMRSFKIFVTLVLTVVMFQSCSLSDDDTINVQYELLPVEEAFLPTEMTVNEIYEITVSFILPTDCHAYNDIYYSKVDFERTVAIVSAYFANNEPCETQTAIFETNFNFKPLNSGTYTFKFWKGTDDSGTDLYEEVLVEVSE